MVCQSGGGEKKRYSVIEGEKAKEKQEKGTDGERMRETETSQKEQKRRKHIVETWRDQNGEKQNPKCRRN